MRCPRCGFDGEQVDSACARCGYRRVSAGENESSARMPGMRARSDSLRGVSGPLSSPPLSLREISGQLRSPSMPLRDVSGPLRSPSMPLRDVSGPLRSPSMPLRGVSEPLRPLASSSRSLSTAKSGDTLNQGRYRLIDQLVLPDNQQGQGAAWLAIDTLAGQMQVVVREVVVPVGDPVQKQQMVRQVARRLSEGVQHSSFPRILDIFNELDNYFIVFQHVEGESLASLLRRQGGALPERTVAEYGRQLCEMLAALAQQPQPIVHGAISPETVVVSPDRSRVHLVHLPLLPPRESPTASTMTGYKAPEQAREPATPASDLYSVAATMHHAVTGFNPRERIAFFYPPARRLNPLVSPQMETILIQELHLSSQQRYARAADMQAALIDLLAARGSEAQRKSLERVGDPSKEGMISLRRRSRKRSQVQLGIFVGICLLILGGLLLAYFSPLLSLFMNTTASTPQGLSATATTAALQSALNSEWQAEAPLYQSKGIGISDGRYVFDTYSGRSDVELNQKKEAAQALLANNMPLALQDYGLAITNDKTDAEARIYYEDAQIAAQKDSSVTIVLGLPLDGDQADLALSRADMQAAFAFQHQVNTQNPSFLPGGVKLRLLIANSGADTLNGSSTSDGNVATVAQFISRRVQVGNPDHILAVVGWPKSQESATAITVLATAQIPLLAPTASAPALSGISPYFFHVSPTATAQGQAQAQFAYQALKARSVLVVSDPNDPYGQALASAFSASFKQLSGNPVANAAYNFTEEKTSVNQFEQMIVEDALNNHVDLIYLAGVDVDAVRLAHALGEESRVYAWSAYLAHLKILGDDSFDSGMLLGQGTDPDAQIALNYPQDMQHLLFTAFADQGEGGSQLQSMLDNWSKLYPASAGSNVAAPVPTSSAIMVNDAFGVLTDALGQVGGALTGANLRTALANVGTGSIKPYQGASGQIAFNSKGDPVNKTLVLLEVASNGTSGQNEIKFVATSNPAS